MKFGTARRRSHSERPGNAPLPEALRTRHEIAEPPSSDPLGRDSDLARLEAVLMMADEPLAARRLAEAAGLANPEEVRRLLDRL